MGLGYIAVHILYSHCGCGLPQKSQCSRGMSVQDPKVLHCLERLQHSLSDFITAMKELMAARDHAEPLEPPKLGRAQLLFMQLLCHPDNYSYRQIAAYMGVELTTVYTHRLRLCEKFNVRGKQGLIKLGTSWGLAV